MNGRWTTERLLDAIGNLCNGTIDEVEGRELDEMLASDAQARRVYTNYMWTHACLYAEGGSLHTDDAATNHAELASQLDLHAAESTAASRRRGRSWYGLAAAMIGVAAFSGWVTARWTDRQIAEQTPTAAEQLAVPEAEAVARITGTHNCIWGDSHEPVGYGSSLFPGQRIELAEGLAEITFDDGATLLLEGPASFNVDSSNKVALLAGRLAAVVPQRAEGFHVHTTSLDVFDVGTEFGLVAQESGAAEVHVFNGLVKADVLDNQGRATRRLELNAAEAARISPLSTTVVEFPANDAGFVRNISPSVGPHDGLLADEAFRYPEGPLEAQNGGFGWAGPWFTTSADDEDAGPDSNRVTPGSLAVQGIVPVGNRAILIGNRNRIRRQLATSVGGVFDAEGLVENQDEVRLVGRDGKNVYLSFVQRVSQVNDGFYGLELHRGDGNGNRVLCIGNGADGAGYGATSNVNVYGAKNLPSLGVESSEPNFFVVKVAFGVGNRDTLEIYRNPASLRDEKECKPDAVLRGNFAFDRISLANFDGSKVHEVDELRVGTHFLAVTGRWGNNQGRLRQPIAHLNGIDSRPTAGSVETGRLNRFWLVASGGQ
ncbi:MAG: hypothetical protein C0485_16715 [Pirellula sp.]|nr:hypothetical protein [Pirellula sp.]